MAVAQEAIWHSENLISGIGAITGVGQWVVVLIGYVGIIYVMFSGARRLEVRQNKKYGNDPEYQKYVTTVPILFPSEKVIPVAEYVFPSAA